MAEHSERIAAEANQIPVGALTGPEPWRVSASTTLGQGAVASLEHRLVAVGPRAPGALVTLAAIAQELTAALTPHLSVHGHLTESERDWIAIQVAGSALWRVPDGPTSLEPWMPQLAEALCPRPDEAVKFRGFMERLGDGVLAQPPAELERIEVGYVQRRVPRIARAWRRGVFNPVGLELDAWLEGRGVVTQRDD